MSLFESIFGSSHSQTDLMDTRTQGLANQAFNNAYGQYAQQQSMNSAQAGLAGQAYNQALLGQYHMYKDKPKWVLNGVDYDLQGFAKALFPDDEEAQLLLILKYGGV